MSAVQSGQKKLRLTIGAKLVGLIATLLLGSVVILVWQSTNMYVEDNRALIQKMNSDAAAGLATRMRETFQDITDKMRMLGTVLVQDTVPAEVRSRVAQEFFSKDHDFLAVLIHTGAQTPTPALLPASLSPELAAVGDADGVKTLAALSSEKDFSIAAMSRGVIQFVPFHLPDGTTAVAIGVPFIATENVSGVGPQRFSHTLTAIIRQAKFLKAVSESDSVTSYMIDQRGHLVAHPDAARAAATEDVSQTGIVKIMLEGKAGNGQTSYPDPQSGESRLGAYALVGFGGLGIVSEVPEGKAFEAAQSVKRRSIYIALIILSVAFLAGYLFSNSISKRIKKLVDAAHQISQGDFAIDLRPKGGDEVSTLSLAFNDMAKGLEERDRVKETFNKFHNKEIADKLLSGEVKLGGERKEATIFFSDVRGFTAMSESMEPEQVVEMLNEYMTRMVAIIRAHNGIVDKYVGDAIMAIWGVPLGGPDDALNAVKACIAMRIELARLNELRISRGQAALKIGMGLNTGSVIAGNIGSNEKMEYTVIGDSVNLASRMESMTKEYGTDLLVPKVIQERLASSFVFQPCKSAKVKGKSQAIEVFKIRGYIDEAGQKIIVETPYSSYESEKSDKGVPEEPVTGALHSASDTSSIPTSTPTPPPPSIAAIEASRRIPRPNPQELSAPDSLDSPVAPSPDEAYVPFETPVEWFVQVGREALGPFNETRLREAFEKQEFAPGTLVSNDRAGPWMDFSASPTTLPDSAATPTQELSSLPDISLLLTPPPAFDSTLALAPPETSEPPQEERTAVIVRARPRLASPAASSPSDAFPPQPQPPVYNGPNFAATKALTAPVPANKLMLSRADRRKPRRAGTRPIVVPPENKAQNTAAVATFEISPIDLVEPSKKKSA